jgi:hypothetical protein
MLSLTVWSILSTILACGAVGSLVSVALSLCSIREACEHSAWCAEQHRLWTEHDRDMRTIDDLPPYVE